MRKGGIKELEELADMKNREQYPAVPEHARVKARHKDDTANGLTKCVLSWLTLNGHKCWRQSAEGRYRQGKRVTNVLGQVKQLPGQYIPGTNTGHGDVASIIDGIFCSWEVKMKDRQSEKQKKFQQEVEASGGKYFLIHTFDEFMMYYKQLTRKNENNQ